jgi:hypothetical protein
MLPPRERFDHNKPGTLRLQLCFLEEERTMHHAIRQGAFFAQNVIIIRARKE